MKLKRLDRSAKRAIRHLRKTKLDSGMFFMINSDKLPSNQCYIENPDGLICLASLSRKLNDFEVITRYSLEESNLIREKFKLASLARNA